MTKDANGKCVVGVMFHRYGPYHICRINSVSDFFDTIGFEFSSETKDYKWDKVTEGQRFKRITIFKDSDSRDVATSILELEIFKALDANPVDVLMINGWGDRGALIALKWCLKNKKRAILMTEEVAITFKRTWIKEFPKKMIVRLFDAALVGGDAQVRYVTQLGMPRNLMELGYDIIDNAYFGEKAALVRETPEMYRAKYNLPEKFFLTSNRFIAKKNLFRLLEAYKKYILHNGSESWHLVMLGDGELREELEDKVKELELQDMVIMPGFLQYDTLPHYYALAKVFIHASTSEQWGLVVNEAMAAGLPVIVSDQCGCSENLVKDGNNGFRFNPFEVDELAEKMIELGAKSNNDLNKMADMSREIINLFAPVVFGKNTQKLINKIQGKEIGTKSLFKKLILNMVLKSAPIK